MTPWDLFAAAAITGTMVNGDARDCAVMAAEAADLLMAERRKRMGDDVRGEADTMAMAREAMPQVAAWSAPTPDEDEALVAANRGRGGGVPDNLTRARERVALRMMAAGASVSDIAAHLGVNPNVASRIRRRAVKRGRIDMDHVAGHAHNGRRVIDAVVRQRREIAADMAMAGHSNAQIGERLGVSVQAAHLLARQGLEKRDRGLSHVQLVERYRGYSRGRPPAHVQKARDRVWSDMRKAGKSDRDVAQFLGISYSAACYKRLRAGGS